MLTCCVPGISFGHVFPEERLGIHIRRLLAILKLFDELSNLVLPFPKDHFGTTVFEERFCLPLRGFGGEIFEFARLMADFHHIS